MHPSTTTVIRMLPLMVPLAGAGAAATGVAVVGGNCTLATVKFDAAAPTTLAKAALPLPNSRLTNEPLRIEEVTVLCAARARAVALEGV